MISFEFSHWSGGLMAASILFAGAGAVLGASKSASSYLVYVGTYTGAKSKGIYAYHMSASSGALTPLGLAAETANPTFLAVHPNHKFLYAANEIGEFGGKKRTGAIGAFAMDLESGKLTLLNQQPSGGGGPCHLTVDQTGRYVLAANYGGGSICALPIRDDGSLGEASAFIQHKGSSVNKQRQEAPHAHGIYLDAANHFAFVADLGLDRILIYKFDPAKGTLLPNDPPSTAVHPGAGPRHFAFHPQGAFAYVINEMACTITAFQYKPENGALAQIQTISTLPQGESVKPAYSTAEIDVHPSGRFLYGSNRGHDTIAVFSIDSASGQLQLVQHQSTLGKTPRHFGIDPTGTFLLAANQGTDAIVVFKIDSQSGQLTPTGKKAEGIGAPVCVEFVPLK